MAPPPPACVSCGAVPEVGARFCGVCGEKLAEAPLFDDDDGPPTRPQDVPRIENGRLVGAAAPAPAVAQAIPDTVVSAKAPAFATTPAVAAAAALPAPAVAPKAAAVAPKPDASEGKGGRRANPLDKLIGRTLNNRYVIKRKIGEGGFGAVFEGRQVATGREVALKVLHPHNVSDSTVVARFRREAEACSKLRNPHTVILYDFDETSDGILYLAMELVRGRSLQQMQKSEGPIPPVRVLEILRQVADALGEAHEQGLVHRDMKPENVMVETRDGDDFVKVLDFGIAKIISGDAAKNAPALTAFGQTVGTLEFMSPEQLRGHALDGRSDLYALGMMSYEMLTGALPFAEAKSPTDIIQFHLHTPSPPPSRLRPELKIPSSVDEVVVKMVAKNPADRHADAADLRKHIEETVASLDNSATRRETMRVVVVIGTLLAVVAAIVVLVSR